jgi:hypothetical protein
LSWLVVLLVFHPLDAIQAQTVILHLRNGDRVTGTMVSENANQAKLSTVLIKVIVAPLDAIGRREIVPTETTTAIPPRPVEANPSLRHLSYHRRLHYLDPSVWLARCALEKTQYLVKRTANPVTLRLRRHTRRIGSRIFSTTMFFTVEWTANCLKIEWTVVPRRISTWGSPVPEPVIDSDRARSIQRPPGKSW